MHTLIFGGVNVVVRQCRISKYNIYLFAHHQPPVQLFPEDAVVVHANDLEVLISPSLSAGGLLLLPTCRLRRRGPRALLYETDRRAHKSN